jgi:hypothetical protein
MDDFCEDGRIDWEKLVRFNAEKKIKRSRRAK